MPSYDVIVLQAQLSFRAEYQPAAHVIAPQVELHLQSGVERARAYAVSRLHMLLVLIPVHAHARHSVNKRAKGTLFATRVRQRCPS